MGKHLSADFYEVYKRRREELEPVAPPAVAPEAAAAALPAATAPAGQDAAASVPPNPSELPAPATSSARASLPAAPAASAARVSLPAASTGRNGLAGLARSEGNGITVRRSTVTAALILCVIGFASAYILGHERGRVSALETAGMGDPASGSQGLAEAVPQAAVAVQPAAAAPAARFASRIPKKSDPRSAYTLVLNRYPAQSETRAKDDLRRLKDEGFLDAGLARDNQSFYLFYGKFPSLEDPKLQEYFTLFSGRNGFKDCFVRPVSK
ncbi:MAG: hypothetical protein HYU36_11770 [Planctomycetes bacterium]|nr:hypothetical protein [Planctomycetota bacterium]